MDNTVTIYRPEFKRIAAALRNLQSIVTMQMRVDTDTSAAAYQEADSAIESAEAILDGRHADVQASRPPHASSIWDNPQLQFFPDLPPKDEPIDERGWWCGNT